MRFVRRFYVCFDSIRDVRGPSQGRSTYRSKQLQKICRELKLVDAGITLHGNTFTRVQGTSQSRIDTVYIPNELFENLETCDVISLAPWQRKLSDHMPVLFTLKAQLGRHCSKLWRMDSGILNDEVSISEMRMNIYASLEDTPQITPTAWNLLKARWRVIAQEAGKMRHARLTLQMNETLRRIKIVERAGILTGAIQEYTLDQKG